MTQKFNIQNTLFVFALSNQRKSKINNYEINTRNYRKSQKIYYLFCGNVNCTPILNQVTTSFI